MSHGNRQKVGIVQAFMHRPDLLILDEPTTGAGPAHPARVPRPGPDARDEGRAVFLSSHILYEVESVADVVGILRQASLVVVESVDRLKAQALRRIDLDVRGRPAAGHAPDGWTPYVRSSRRRRPRTSSWRDPSRRAAGARGSDGIVQVVTHEPDLEEIFMAYYGREA